MARFRSSSVCWFHSLKGMYCELNPLSSRKSASAWRSSSAPIPISSPLYLEYRIHFMTERFFLVVLSPEVRPFAFPLFSRLPPLLFRGKPSLFAPADPPMRVQPFQHELGCRCPHRIRFVGGQPQRLHFLHQALDAAELSHHRFGIHRLIQLQRSAQIEPLNDLRHVRALEIVVVDLPDRRADQLARHRVA